MIFPKTGTHPASCAGQAFRNDALCIRANAVAALFTNLQIERILIAQKDRRDIRAEGRPIPVYSNPRRAISSGSYMLRRSIITGVRSPDLITIESERPEFTHSVRITTAIWHCRTQSVTHSLPCASAAMICAPGPSRPGHRRARALPMLPASGLSRGSAPRARRRSLP